VATTSADIDRLAGQLRLALARTARRLRREAASELSATLTAALATIERHGPLTPSEVARREGIQRPSATKVISRLEAEALIERTADPADGRSSLLTVSVAGRELLRESRTRKDVFLAERLRALPAEDRATLERAAVLLEQLLELEDGRA
jgi:DNA-binding MarR family transcriptional regulator